MSAREDERIWECCEECGVCGSAAYQRLFSVNEKSYVRCDACHVTRLYDRVAFDRLGMVYGDYYDSSRAQLSKQELGAQLANPTFAFRRARLESFAPKNQRAIFEIGCGDGNFLAYLRKHGWQVNGCEFSRQTLALVKLRHDLDIHDCDFTMSGIAHGTLENVGAYHVLEHIYEPLKWIKSVRRALKTGGLLHLQMPNFSCPERFLARDCWGSLYFPQHVYFYGPSNLLPMLVNEGFQPLSTVTYDPWHSPGTTLTSAKNLLRKMLTGKSPWAVAFDASLQAAPPEMNGNGRKPRKPVIKVLDAVGHGAAATLARTQSLFGFGNIIDVVARAC